MHNYSCNLSAVQLYPTDKHNCYHLAYRDDLCKCCIPNVVTQQVWFTHTLTLTAQQYAVSGLWTMKGPRVLLRWWHYNILTQLHGNPPWRSVCAFPRVLSVWIDGIRGCRYVSACVYERPSRVLMITAMSVNTVMLRWNKRDTHDYVIYSSLLFSLFALASVSSSTHVCSFLLCFIHALLLFLSSHSVSLLPIPHGMLPLFFIIIIFYPFLPLLPVFLLASLLHPSADHLSWETEWDREWEGLT